MDTKKRIRTLVGQIPEPDELFGREEFIRHLWRVIEANNILLLAPRRFGKSGVMRHVFLHPKPGYIPISFELEDVDSSEEFVWRITKELLARHKLRTLIGNAKRLPSWLMGWIKDTFDEAEFEGAKIKFKDQLSKEDWRESARAMLLVLEKDENTILFLLDELPAMLDRIVEKKGEEAALEFMAWFRSIRQAQKDVLRRHRFIVAGSVGIDQILLRIGAADKLVDFVRLTVEPLDDLSARELAEGLAQYFEIRWNAGLSEKLFSLIGSQVPYFIHMFFSQLGQLSPGVRAQLGTADLESIYKERILGPTCRHYFDHYSHRLKRYGKTGEKAAMDILRAVAGKERVSRPVLQDLYQKSRGKGATDREFDELMAALEYDWYLRLDPDTNEYYFRLKVMKDWWRRWYPESAADKKIRNRRQQ